MTVYVLDASAGADLLLDTRDGRELSGRLQPRAQWWVPEHYFVEVSSVVRRAELLGAVTEGDAARALGSLERAPLQRVQVRPLLSAAWQHRGHLTMYDAIYVVLAEHLGATLVTSDRRLARAPGLPIEAITPD